MSASTPKRPTLRSAPAPNTGHRQTAVRRSTDETRIAGPPVRTRTTSPASIDLTQQGYGDPFGAVHVRPGCLGGRRRPRTVLTGRSLRRGRRSQRRSAAEARSGERGAARIAGWDALEHREEGPCGEEDRGGEGAAGRTRVIEGRARADRASDRVRAQEPGEAVGGDPRASGARGRGGMTAVPRLVEKGQLKSQGQKRSTTFTAGRRIAAGPG